MLNRNELLAWEVHQIAQWLSCFDGNRTRRVGIGKSGETLYVQNFPLPDGYSPDFLDIALVIKAYPQDPPIGVYLRDTEANQNLIRQIKLKLNVFKDATFHEAPPIEGYAWVCFGYGLDGTGWKFNARAPNQGDNLYKFLRNFFRVLGEE